MPAAFPPAVHGPTVTAPTIAGKRTCAVSGCDRVLAKATRDPHTVCITCRGYCAQSSRCQECVLGFGGLVGGWAGSISLSFQGEGPTMPRVRVCVMPAL